MIGKQHFTLLYDRARRKAMNFGNIVSGWSRTGLRPFNQNRVLKEIQKLQILKYYSSLMYFYQSMTLKLQRPPKFWHLCVKVLR